MVSIDWGFDFDWWLPYILERNPKPTCGTSFPLTTSDPVMPMCRRTCWCCCWWFGPPGPADDGDAAAPFFLFPLPVAPPPSSSRTIHIHLPLRPVLTSTLPVVRFDRFNISVNTDSQTPTDRSITTPLCAAARTRTFHCPLHLRLLRLVKHRIVEQPLARAAALLLQLHPQQPPPLALPLHRRALRLHVRQLRHRFVWVCVLWRDLHTSASSVTIRSTQQRLVGHPALINRSTRNRRPVAKCSSAWLMDCEAQRHARWIP